MVDYKKRISINSEIRFGRPCIKNTRIAVYDVLNWLAEGMTHSEILEDFPELKDEDIFACLAYAADKDAKLLRAS
ncbi:DUF433 domain-containing protein [Salibacter halophilus]|jgi:uncharacterized protein (DUF433 family)|uniref:DUF433 domain-containing protein n=1 Tax=Salibacter halophilus TaxID=1803916 RepID=A0A6N6M6I0_9FLAO|nr:DUF433 domain-containing protein [Salibacter halophilus]KAB1063224.1 DUF433 domain-containing protein [Salibacter halophilus]